ncbi:carbonic anhydrase [Tumebacillus sp. ITR2]|uniref:Carbonic anhydrase n=1 Tax=Tumebacillus amylolyticus TaxID=2801339 RepID=A0ABS1JDU2_9BACL|nr:carbonic anhydrase [Tumebacillus amylolyticus]MBL0388409.1 carbonic anhydrase [Tumebacillus amylolyticus]
MKKPWLPALLLPLVLTLLPTQSLQAAHGDPSAAALQVLVDGNERFASGHLSHPKNLIARRHEIAPKQHPIAFVLSCSDSRVPPELVFDQGLGDLFVSRVAGHVLGDEVMGSMEYAVEHLDVPLIVVLGHERCGAVQAAVDALEKGTQPSGHIRSLVKRITPAVKTAQQSHPSDLVEASVRANVQRVVDEIKASHPQYAKRIHERKFRIVGARYDLETGKVELLDCE